MPDPRNILIEVRSLTKRFSNGPERLTVLDGVDLKVPSGEILAVVGPSGSGKSTLLSLMAGLDDPSEGQVLVFGEDLSRLSGKAMSALWGKRMGFIFQSYRLLPTLTAEENVRVPLELAGDRDAGKKARNWLEKVGLKDRMDHLPSRLSGGEQQRVAFARALCAEPDILFADEPTGNLDSRTGADIADLLFSLSREMGHTVVLVTHELSLTQKADRVIELTAGRIVRDTPVPSKAG